MVHACHFSRACLGLRCVRLGLSKSQKNLLFTIFEFNHPFASISNHGSLTSHNNTSGVSLQFTPISKISLYSIGARQETWQFPPSIASGGSLSGGRLPGRVKGVSYVAAASRAVGAERTAGTEGTAATGDWWDEISASDEELADEDPSQVPRRKLKQKTRGTSRPAEQLPDPPPAELELEAAEAEAAGDANADTWSKYQKQAINGRDATAAAAAVADYLVLSDSDLLRQCEVDTFRASGPGGQHRNKTESAVRLRHTPTGQVSQSSEQRSQHQNRATALSRLRQCIALKVRRQVDVEGFTAPPELLRILPPSARKGGLPPGVQHIGPNHRDFILGVRIVLDLLAASDCSVSNVAAILGRDIVVWYGVVYRVSTGALSKVITSEKNALQEVNDMRAAKGLKPLK
eukprot:jgi/Mesen1/9792/ME000007S09844